jgi:hypothetical protein
MSRFITYTNTLALFGLNVMLCYEQSKSTKHWDNCLSHCSFWHMETQKDKEDLLIEAIGKFGYAERHDQGASGKEMENAWPRFQEASAAVPTSALKQRVYTVISEASKASLTPCSSQAEPSALLAAGSPASKDIDLAHNKADLWHESNDSFPLEKAQGSKGELLTEGMKKLEYLDKYLQVFEKETLESRLQAAAEAR